MKEKKKLTIGGIFSQIILLILAVIVLYPLVSMFLHGKLVKLEAFS